MAYSIPSRTPPSKETLLLGRDSKVPKSVLLFPGAIQGPVIQALNVDESRYPWPPIIHSERLNKEPRLVNLMPAILSSIEPQMNLIGLPVAVNTQHWFQIYGWKKGPEKEWAYNWELEEEYLVVTNGQGKYSLSCVWAKELASNLQLISLCIRDIRSHHLFNPNALIPPALGSSMLFRQDYSSEQQVLTLYVRTQGSGLVVEAYFHSAWELRFSEGSAGSQAARKALALAEDNGSLAALKAILERFASSHGPLPKSKVEVSSFPFAYLTDRAEDTIPAPKETGRKAKEDFPWTHLAVSKDKEQYPWVADPFATMMVTPSNLAGATQLLREVEKEVIQERRRERRLTPYPLGRNLRASRTGSSSEGSSSHSSMLELERFVSSQSESPKSSKSSNSDSMLSILPANKENPIHPHPVIRGRVPGYLRHSFSPGFLPQNNGLPVNPLLLAHRYFLTSKENAAIVKAWANVTPRGFKSAVGLLYHCIKFNLGFRLAVPREVLHLFKHSSEGYMAAEMLAAGVPFRQGFMEARLDNSQGSKALCSDYIWKVSNVTQRLNVGAAISHGGILGWLSQSGQSDKQEQTGH
ncbi:hypothetical protein EDD18DRAFT_1116970 [Armillaria luteobubalina]|uniref:Uncharacterized protein n=1 Tax=Armillaria luteobubalina TaxID=153913 RepID=A0AA39NY61_9AGAR|nr:hypothetical protein EDD18DRAFT_1116970 [Armillaria luteobubalina]